MSPQYKEMATSRAKVAAVDLGLFPAPRMQPPSSSAVPQLSLHAGLTLAAFRSAGGRLWDGLRNLPPLPTPGRRRGPPHSRRDALLWRRVGHGSFFSQGIGWGWGALDMNWAADVGCWRRLQGKLVRSA